ncbi:hypothetical protein APLC1_4730 [Limnospira platensis C1]|nr:hypothetical protein APLC1_4730 [Arthrospira platensis C1]
MKPLDRISQELQIPMANLTVDQVVAGFEKESQVKRE